MTDQAAADRDAQLYAAATARLGAVKEALHAASRGEADLAQLEAVLRDYWRQDGPAIRRAGTAVGEVVRQQLLAHLYGWRAQLAAQLQATEQHPRSQRGEAARRGPR